MASWLHHLTHAHTFAEKPGVGEVVVCRPRLLARLNVHVRPAGGSGWTTLAQPGLDAVAALTAAVDADTLRARLRSLASTGGAQ